MISVKRTSIAKLLCLSNDQSGFPKHVEGLTGTIPGTRTSSWQFFKHLNRGGLYGVTYSNIIVQFFIDT